MEKFEKEFIIKNTNRAVGSRISHHLYKKYGYDKFEILDKVPNWITIRKADKITERLIIRYDQFQIKNPLN